MSRTLKVVIYDAAEKTRYLAWSWRAGASLLGFDVVIAARSWAEAFDKLAMKRVRSVSEVQFWGHGYSGGVALDHKPLALADLREIRAVMAPGALWWWRTCSSFSGHDGQRFARNCVEALGQRVAGSTFAINLWHSGQRSLRPATSTDGTVLAAAPHWIPAEGLDDHGKPLWSSSKAPNTLPFYAKSLPSEW